MRRTSRSFYVWLASVLLLVLVIAPAASAASPADPPWTNSTLLPSTEVVRFDTEFYNGKVYMLGFRAGTAGTTDGSVWIYDVATSTWSDSGVDMPVPVSNYTIAKLTDSTGVGLYLFGGRDSAGACTDAVQVYYPDTNTSATVATDPWTGEVNPGERVFPGSVEVVNNMAYAFGGFCGGTTSPFVSAQTLAFDPMAAAGSRWTHLSDMVQRAAYPASAVVDGKVYSVGGDTFDGTNLTALDTVQMLDTANLGAGWQAKASLPLPSSAIVGCGDSRAFGFDTSSGWSLAGKVVLAGCGQWPDELTDSFMYDVAADSWSSFAALNQARRNFGNVFVVDTGGTTGFMWVGGGYIPGGTNLGTDLTEIYQVTRTPTAVTLADVSGRSGSELPWIILAVALLGFAMFVALSGKGWMPRRR